MIQFQCKNCGQKIKVQEKFAGKKGKCPKCKHLIVIPPAKQNSIQESSIIKFRCPSCNQKIGVTSDLAGKRLRCAKCRNPLQVPQTSKPAETSAAKDQTKVLRAGHEQRPPEKDFLQEMSNLDVQHSTKSDLFEIPLEQAPIGYSIADSQSLEYPDHLQQPDSFTQIPETKQQSVKSRKTLFIVAACIGGFFLLCTIVYFYIIGSGADPSPAQPQMTQVQEFVEQYIGLLENGEIDKSRQLLKPELASYVQNSQIERLADQITRDRIIEINCLQTFYEQDSEGDRFFLLYFLRYEDKGQSLVASVLQNEQGLKISGIAARDNLGREASIGTEGFEELYQTVATAAFEQFGSYFTGFFCGFAVVMLLLSLIYIVSLWIVFDKAGYPGWASIVPFYNMWVLAEVGDKSGWLGLFMIFSGAIPFVGFIIQIAVSLVISIGVARAFDRGAAFGIGLGLLPFIFFPILAFSKS